MRILISSLSIVNALCDHLVLLRLKMFKTYWFRDAEFQNSLHII